ncbi:MAG: Carbon monoxide dehydrogenase small chain [Syntrophorhabdus sp. PtaB.Bin184]|jgi:carbon-monoxide dehydrogenase small subunit|nr:MAG: Carbon monoxide dehydrogenase small chain [Syntrophorhabdus sp. PtaB.Bin184]
MEKQVLRFKVNGDEYEIFIHPKTLLVEAIRDHLGLTGTKRGCDTVSCGACTVMVNGFSVKSCSVLAIQCQGMEITTVEGLEKNGKLSPVQKAFLDNGAFQCGFCTPGMLISSTTFINELNGKVPSDMEIREGIEGNVCRCTGYNSIVRAIDAVAQGKYKEE